MKTLLKFLFSYLVAGVLATALAITTHSSPVDISIPGFLLLSLQRPLEFCIQFLEGSLAPEDCAAFGLFIFTFSVLFWLLLRIRKKGELVWDLPKRSRWKIWP
ncbi:hypothetical protein [Pseudomonas sp. NPDC086278]|uniref:hypothetical protein n=1 Tax=Pseudomonas sp. NPDC086278 TaxID=3390646 RepID=UPI003CFBED70